MAADLAAAVDDLAADLDGITRRKAGSTQEFMRGDVPFAALEGSTLTVRLRPEVAEAALRTPDTTGSARGSGWVSLRPTTLDAFAIDRATAWFEAAWRFALEP